MNIKFGMLINVNGEFQGVETTLEGEVVLHVIVKGKDATITMNAGEALKLKNALVAADVDGLALCES